MSNMPQYICINRDQAQDTCYLLYDKEEWLYAVIFHFLATTRENMIYITFTLSQPNYKSYRSLKTFDFE